MGVDWTATMRESQSVKEYILIGEIVRNYAYLLEFFLLVNPPFQG